MPTWKKILMVLLFAIAGVIVAYIGIKQHKENADSTDKRNVFDQYLSIQKSEENTDLKEDNNVNTQNSSNDAKTDSSTDEDQGVQLTDEPFKEVEVKGTDEEKAIALAKNKWKSDTESVTFNIAKREGNIFYVSINDNRTTKVLAWYQIDIDSGEVSDF